MKAVMECSKKYNIKVIVTNDCHYTTKARAKYQQVKKTISMRKPMEEGDASEYYMKSYNQMAKIFKGIGSEWLHNTVEIADQCNVTIEFGKVELPKFVIPKDEKFEKFKKGRYGKNDQQAYLRYIAFKGLREKGLSNNLVYVDRLKDELETIMFTGFDRYFLIVSEYCEWTRNEKIRVGVGRGCFLPGSKVITDSGDKNIEDIKVGDFVLSHDRTWNEVENTLEYDCDEEILELETEDGRVISCTNNHEILINREGERVWIRADELSVGDDVVDLNVNKEE